MQPTTLTDAPAPRLSGPLPDGDGVILVAADGAPLAVRVHGRMVALTHAAAEAIAAERYPAAAVPWAAVRALLLSWDKVDATARPGYHDDERRCPDMDGTGGWWPIEPDRDAESMLRALADQGARSAVVDAAAAALDGVLGYDTASRAATAALSPADPADSHDVETWGVRLDHAWNLAYRGDDVSAGEDPAASDVIDTLIEILSTPAPRGGPIGPVGDDLGALVTLATVAGDLGACDLDDLAAALRDCDPDDGQPAMTVGWPLGRSVDASDVAIVRDRLPLTVTDGPEGPHMGLTGGGMDLTWDIAAGYVLLGYRPPMALGEPPRFAGSDDTRGTHAAILAIMADTARSVAANAAGLAARLDARRTGAP